MVKEVKQWITINGVHVPIYEGEGKDAAVKRAIAKQKEAVNKNEDQKAKDIKKNQDEKDKLNADKKPTAEKGSGPEVDKVKEGNNLSSKKFDEVKKDLDSMKSKDIVEYSRRDEDGNTVKEVYARQDDGSYEMKNGYGHHDDSEYLADYMKENGGSYKVRDLAKEDSERLKKADKQLKEYQKKKEASKTEKQEGLSKEKLDDAVDYYRKNAYGYDNIEDYVRTDFPFASKEKQDKIIDQISAKISGKKSFSDASSGKAVDEVRGKKAESSNEGNYDKYKSGYRYEKMSHEVTVNGNKYKVWSDDNSKGTFAEDKNGKVLPISSSGYIHKDLTVRKAIANTFKEDTYREKGKASSGSVKVPKSFAANYPNLSTTQLKAKYEEFLKKNRK